MADGRGTERYPWGDGKGGGSVEAFRGSVVAVFVGPEAEGPLAEIEEVRALAGQGLEGDRYFRAEGTYTRAGEEHAPHRHVTLIEQEAIEAARRDYKVPLGLGEPRRNIVTSGVPLNHLVDREFTVGEARLRGVKLCEPCNHMESLSKPGARKALLHRGGLNAEILESGTIRPGDAIAPA
jgi:MOSC domain-containing protein YiiM